MSKYNGSYRDEVYKEEPVPVATEEVEIETNDPEENNWKKRYGDLRKHNQSLVTQKERRIDELEQQLGQATKQQIKFPKSKEEIAQWMKKYPDVAAIIDSIAQIRALEASETVEKKFSRVKELEDKVAMREALVDLKKAHPDFESIRTDPAFHDWVGNQSQWVQDALYKNKTDAKAASDAIDLYKAKMGIRKKAKTDPKDAAKGVGRTGSSAPSGQSKARFTESMVEKMSLSDYEKNETAILESMKSPDFYDLKRSAAY